MSDQLTRRIKGFEEDHAWVGENWQRLLGEYCEQWVAVQHRQVIASDVNLDALLAKLADPAHTCIEYVTREPLEMIL
jgi:hypothetical protein